MMGRLGSTAKRVAKSLLERTDVGFRYFLLRDHGAPGPRGRPNAPWANATLKSADEVQRSIEQVRDLGLPSTTDPRKNWDSLAALALLLKETTPNASILDAGGAHYSMILPWLSLYGYRNLVAANISFQARLRRGPITYEYGDITATKYRDTSFHAITCLSVIEHGVDIAAYFREMARLLKPGGVIITSTDYWDQPVDTTGKMAYGAPVRVLSRVDLIDAIRIAASHGLQPISPPELDVRDRVVHWEEQDLRYTFLTLSMRKTP